MDYLFICNLSFFYWKWYFSISSSKLIRHLEGCLNISLLHLKTVLFYTAAVGLSQSGKNVYKMCFPFWTDGGFSFHLMRYIYFHNVKGALFYAKIVLLECVSSTCEGCTLCQFFFPLDRKLPFHSKTSRASQMWSRKQKQTRTFMSWDSKLLQHN